MANETRYLYSINPKKVIKFLCGNMMKPPIRVSKSLRLTKEEVLDCLKYGSVYRRFANENRIERVTTLNIDRLHNEKFLTEEEYYKMMTTKESDDNRGTVINEEPFVEEKEVVEQVEETHQEVEDTVEEEIAESEKEDVEFEEDSKEEVEEESVEDTEPTQSPVEEATEESSEENHETSNNKQQYYHNKNYGGKNKHRH